MRVLGAGLFLVLLVLAPAAAGSPTPGACATIEWKDNPLPDGVLVENKSFYYHLTFWSPFQPSSSCQSHSCSSSQQVEFRADNTPGELTVRFSPNRPTLSVAGNLSFYANSQMEVKLSRVNDSVSSVRTNITAEACGNGFVTRTFSWTQAREPIVVPIEKPAQMGGGIGSCEDPGDAPPPSGENGTGGEDGAAIVACGPDQQPWTGKSHATPGVGWLAVVVALLGLAAFRRRARGR